MSHKCHTSVTQVSHKCHTNPIQASVRKTDMPIGLEWYNHTHFTVSDHLNIFSVLVDYTAWRSWELMSSPGFTTACHCYRVWHRWQLVTIQRQKPLQYITCPTFVTMKTHSLKAHYNQSEPLLYRSVLMACKFLSSHLHLASMQCILPVLKVWGQLALQQPSADHWCRILVRIGIYPVLGLVIGTGGHCERLLRNHSFIADRS